MVAVWKFLANLFMLGLPMLIISLLIWAVVCWILGVLHKRAPSKIAFAVMTLAICCFGFCFAWTYDGLVLDDTEQNYLDALVEKELESNAKNGYKSDVELADKIIAELEPYANDEQREMIDAYREQKTKTIEEVYDEYKNDVDAIMDASHRITESVSSMLEEQNNSGQQ